MASRFDTTLAVRERGVYTGEIIPDARGSSITTVRTEQY
jgi:hypothetical protein